MSEKTAKGQRTKQRIETVAWELFAQKGFEKTTMREIAKEAGGCNLTFQPDTEMEPDAKTRALL